MSVLGKRCVRKSPKLEALAVERLLDEVPGYELDAQWTSISREFEFKNFLRTMAFVNAVAYIANQEDHHPDLEVSYAKCRVRFSTHDAGGLTENDFICAARVNALLRD